MTHHSKIYTYVLLYLSRVLKTFFELALETRFKNTILVITGEIVTLAHDFILYHLRQVKVLLHVQPDFANPGVALGSVIVCDGRIRASEQREPQGTSMV